MGFRALRRAFAVTVGVGLLSANAAFADVVRTDGDIVDTDLDSLVELGPVAPGTVIEIDVGFELQCGGFLHVESFQSIVLTPGIRSIPPGAAVDYTGATIDAPGAGWPVDGDLCGTPPDPVKATLPAQVTLTAPMTVDEGYLYTLSWSRAMSPAAPGDFGTLSGLTAVTFTLDVVSNTPPTLSLPAAVELEGDRTGGAVAAYTVGAADAEDDPDPVVKCTPAPGADVSLGTTTVTCSATDSGGLKTTGSFPLTVVDTTAPTLVGMPGDQSLATADPAGARLDFVPPTATDIVDGSPSVVCSPASGAIVAVGTSKVTCTATDASGNATTASFGVSVQLWTVIWEEPVGDDAAIVSNSSRKVPVKVSLLVDGSEVMTGPTILRATRCDATGAAVEATLTWGGGNGRWNGHLDTSLLPGTGCYRVAVVAGGLDIASFRLDVTGPVTLAKQPAKGKTTP